MITGNKGEWSELYVFLKLIADGVLYGADAELKKLEKVFYPIVKIMRYEKNQDPKEYHTGQVIRVVNANNNAILLECDVEDFLKMSKILLQEIKSAHSSSFSIPMIEKFMEDIKCTSIKARSGEKRDITMVVHDMSTNMFPVLGFSIKSKLGGASTLFNANKTSNFVFEICNINLNEQDIVRINNISCKSKIRDRLHEISALGGRLVFRGFEGDIFSLNLAVIDSCLPEILSHMVRMYYDGLGTSIASLVEKLERVNPLGFDLSYGHPFYTYKIKKMLNDMALGMTSAEVWNGIYDANGGYIIVREDGEVLCYHIYNKNEFEDYLLRNTRFDTPSSSRHDFGQIYINENRYYIKLGLQIRF